MAVVLEALPHLWELDLHISKSDGKKRGLGPMRVTRARARAFRTPVMANKTPSKKKAPNPIRQSNEANDGSRLTSLAEEAPAPFTCTAVPWSKDLLHSNSVTPIVDEATTVLFSNGQPGLSPLYLKRMRIGCSIEGPQFEKVPTEFVLGPMPGPPTPKERKLLVGTSGKMACGIRNRNSVHSRIAPVKWAPPLRFPSTSSLPIWTRPTEWDDDEDDDVDVDDDFDDDDGDDDKDKILPPK